MFTSWYPSAATEQTCRWHVLAKLLCALQLRDLVPPQSKDSSSQDNLDPSKRPKHVVLSDTIQLVRVLQNKVSLSWTHGRSCLLPVDGEQGTHTDTQPL